MSSSTHKPSPSSFIGQARQQLKQELESLFSQFLNESCPPAPAKSNVWVEETKRDIQVLLRSSKARKTYTPQWPKPIFQLSNVDQEEKLNYLNQYLQDSILTTNKLCNLTPLDTTSPDTQSIDQQASKILLPALKPSFQTCRSIAPQLHQRLWMYLNFSVSIGRHLASNKLGESYPLCTAICMQFAGAISCFQFLHAALRRRPDQAKAIEWLAHYCLEQITPELSYKIAKDWQLTDPVLNELAPSGEKSQSATLDKTSEECQIASYSCLLYNQGLIDKKMAQHCLSQWQLPIQLLKQFEPKH